MTVLLLYAPSASSPTEKNNADVTRRRVALRAGSRNKTHKPSWHRMASTLWQWACSVLKLFPPDTVLVAKQGHSSRLSSWPSQNVKQAKWLQKFVLHQMTHESFKECVFLDPHHSTSAKTDTTRLCCVQMQELGLAVRAYWTTTSGEKTHCGEKAVCERTKNHTRVHRE